MPACMAIKVAAAILIGASALAGCSAGAGALQHRANSYSVSGQVRTLVVKAHVGSVHVIGGNSGKISVTEHISFRHTAPVTTHRTAAGALTLDSTCPAAGTCSVGYDIRVPRSMTVQVNDNVGAIRLKSLSGRVTAHTNVGQMDLDSVSGPIQVTVHTGSILGQNVSSVRATLRSSVGGIEVTFSAAPATVTAAAAVGSVTLRVPGNVSYAVDASASVGSTRVSVTRSPASLHAITASAKTGSITIEPAP